jgi:hypothetical protein
MSSFRCHTAKGTPKCQSQQAAHFRQFCLKEDGCRYVLALFAISAHSTTECVDASSPVGSAASEFRQQWPLIERHNLGRHRTGYVVQKSCSPQAHRAIPPPCKWDSGTISSTAYSQPTSMPGQSRRWTLLSWLPRKHGKINKISPIN